MKDHKNKINEMEKYTFCKDHKIPYNGAFIIKNKPTIQVAIFKKVTHKLKDYLIYKKDKEPSIIRTLISEKDREQFFENCVVFSLPQ